ncbi:tetratricopeptide repeat protein [Candidatus Poribacteria bacterium]|nr:tetratricopeptide repeat protein [Candidatus Poribacteria bacterium]
MANRHICGLLLLILSITLFTSIANSEDKPDYYSPENVLKFANYLYEQGDYLRAVNEYQRYLFHKPEHSDQIRYRIALCYRLGGNPKQAIQIFNTFLEKSEDNQLISNSYYQIGASYFFMEDYERTTSYFTSTLQHIRDNRLRAESQQLLGLSLLKQRKWLEAENSFNGLLNSNIADVGRKAKIYREFALGGSQLPKRSPVLAGLFSTILPGTGRLYTGRIGDALNSIVIIGISGWQAYDGFTRDGYSSVKGWTLGTICGIFYVGNIYGSVISARVFNDRVADEYLTTLYIELPY